MSDVPYSLQYLISLCMEWYSGIHGKIVWNSLLVISCECKHEFSWIFITKPFDDGVKFDMARAGLLCKLIWLLHFQFTTSCWIQFSRFGCRNSWEIISTIHCNFCSCADDRNVHWTEQVLPSSRVAEFRHHDANWLDWRSGNLSMSSWLRVSWRRFHTKHCLLKQRLEYGNWGLPR